MVTDGILKPDLLNYKTTSEHDYTLKPSDISKLESSDVIFYVDYELETFIRSFAKNNKKLIQLSSVVNLLPARPHSFSRRITDVKDEKDLHIWLSPENAKRMIIFISAILSEIDKENSSRYNDNAMRAIKKIDQKVKEFAKELNDFKEQKYIVTHDAYQYFEKYFGLSPPNVILNIGEESYVGMKSLMELKKVMKEKNIKCILSNSLEDSIDSKIFSDDTKTVILDPAGVNIEPGKNMYLDMIGNITQNFKSCFAK